MHLKGMSSVQCLDRLGYREDMRDNSVEIFFHYFLQEAPVSSSGMGKDVRSLMLSIPTLKGALRESFGEAVVACDMPEPSKFPFLDSCQKRFLWTHKDVDLAPHPSFLMHLVSKTWIIFSESARWVHISQP